MKSNKSLKDYRTSLTPQCNGAIIKNDTNNGNKYGNQICVNIRDNDHLPNHRHHAHSHETHARTSPHSTNLTIALTVF